MMERDPWFYIYLVFCTTRLNVSLWVTLTGVTGLNNKTQPHYSPKTKQYSNILSYLSYNMMILFI
jgi:hypothetical protein